MKTYKEGDVLRNVFRHESMKMKYLRPLEGSKTRIVVEDSNGEEKVFNINDMELVK